MTPRRSLARRARPVVGFAVILALILVAWEGAKWLAGDPWRYESFLGTGLAIDHLHQKQVVTLTEGGK
jgi:hypothetical protein